MSEAKPIEPISFPLPEIHLKKWGQSGEVGEIWVANNPKYCLKLLKFGAGKSMSFHMHAVKTETWYVLEGELIMNYLDLSNADQYTRILKPGDIVHIPAGNPHRLTAVVDSVVAEASSTHYDFDSYRIAKGDSQS